MRKFLVFIILISFWGICQAQDGIYTLYLYTSEYSGPCVKLSKDMQNNPQMKTALEQYDLVEINVETMTKEDATALKYYVFYKLVKEYPLFVVVDNNGNITKIHHGYDSSSEFIETLDPSTFGDTPYMTVEDFDRISMGQKKSWNEDWSKLRILLEKQFYTRGKLLGIELAQNISNLSGDSEYKIGYQIGVPIYRRLSLKSDFDTGIFFNSIGAKDARLNYIMIPIEVGTRLFRFRPYSMNFSAGVYGAYKVGGDKSYEQFDTGARVKLYTDMGSFRFWLGYQRGFIDVLPDSKAYNNVCTVGANLYLGR